MYGIRNKKPTTAVHEAEDVLNSFVGENPFSGDWTDSPVCKGACHH